MATGHKVIVEITVNENQVQSYKLAAELAEQMEDLKKNTLAVTSTNVKVVTWDDTEVMRGSAAPEREGRFA